VKHLSDIGANVREIRQGLPGKVTQEQFGKLLGVPASVISDIENNKRTPSKHVAKKLAELTGEPAENFIR
jgi:transcriptional regulator with XRE-family HTH domain